MTANQWAIAAGLGRTIWNDLRRHGNPSRRTLERLLGAADSSLAEFEALRTDRAGTPESNANADLADSTWGWRGAPLPPLPLFRCEAADRAGLEGPRKWSIDRQSPVAQVPRPPSLIEEGDAFAIVVPDDCMVPRLRDGRVIAVLPAQRAEIGDDVIVVHRSASAIGPAIAGRLDAIGGATATLYQYGRGEAFVVEVTASETIAVIAGELI